MSNMNAYLQDGYYTDSVANAPESARVAFIRRTYLHVAGAIGVFVGVEALLLKSPLGDQFFKTIVSLGGIGWLGLMLLFMGSGYVARIMARSHNPMNQYLGLALYIVANAIMFLPIMTIATKSQQYGGQNIPLQAGIITLVVFGGLSAAVFLSKKDFSFLGTGLTVLCIGSIGLIAAGCLFGFTLGLWFSFLMVALMCGYILYDTSNVMLHYGTNEHVGAALELFADVVMLFYYIVRILMSSRD